MKKHILAAMLLTTALPMSALAQSSTTDPNATQQTQPMTGQTDAGAMDQTNAGAMDQTAGGPFVTVPSTGAWRVSDLQGKPVYGTDGKSIGDINDVLVSQDGSVNAVIIGVGGFLGIGEKDVAVNTSALQLGPGATAAEAEAASKTQADAAAASANGTAAGEAPATGGMAPSPSDMTATTNTTGDQVTTGTVTQGEADATNAAGRPAEEPQQANAVEIGDDALPSRIILNVTRDQLEKAPEFKGVGTEAQDAAQQDNQ